MIWLSISPLLLLLVLYFATLIVLNTQSGTQFLTNQTNKWLERELPVKASVEQVSISFPLRIQLSGVVIYDHHDSLLLRSRLVRIKPLFPFLEKGKLYVDELIMDEFELNLRKYKGEDDFNFMYVLPESKGGDPIVNSLALRHVVFENGNFRFEQQEVPQIEDADIVDYNYLHLTNFSLILDELAVGSTTSMKVKRLSGREKSGVVLRSIATDLTIGNHQLLFNKSKIKTSKSSAEFDLAFNFDSWSDWTHFIDSVEMEAVLKGGGIDLNELHAFAPAIKKTNEVLSLTGNFGGSVSDFRLQDFSASLEKGGLVEGNLNCSGLPNIDETFLNLELSKADLKVERLEILLGIDFPAPVKRLSYISGRGAFIGFFKDFVANGNFQTGLGKLVPDLHMKLADSVLLSSYNGKLALKQFDLGGFLNDPNFGLASLDAELNGSGLNLDLAQVKMKATVDEFVYNRYRYQDVFFDGELAESFFKGELNSKDAMLNGRFIGTVDLRKEDALYDMQSRVTYINLRKLNFTEDLIEIRGSANVNLRGNKLEDLIGRVSTDSLFIRLNDNKYALGRMQLAGTRKPDFKEWRFESEIATGRIRTSVLLAEIPSIIRRNALSYLPEAKFDSISSAEFEEAYVDLKATIHRPDILLAFVDSSLDCSPGTELSFHTDRKDRRVNWGLNSSYVRYGKIKVYELNLNAEGVDSNLTGALKIESLLFDSLAFEDAGIRFDVDPDEIRMEQFFVLPDRELSLYLNNRMSRKKVDSTRIEIDSAYVRFGEDTLGLSWKDLYWMDLKRFKVNEFALHKGVERLEISGDFNLEGRAKMEYRVEQLSLAHFESQFPEFFHNLNGYLNGNGSFEQSGNFPLITADLSVDSIDFKGLDIERIVLKSALSDSTNSLSIAAKMLQHNGKELISLGGGIKYDGVARTELNARLNSISMEMFDTLLYGSLSNLKGMANGRLRIYGELAKPNYSGFIDFDSASLKVDFLGTTYAFDHRFEIGNKKIPVKELRLYDRRDSSMLLNGSLIHNRFSEFTLDLKAVGEDFHVINLKEGEGELFYGQVFATGNARFEGPLLTVKVSCDMASERGTKIFLPIQEEVGYSQQSYVRFVDFSEDNVQRKSGTEEDFSLDLYFDLNENAEVQLIFDKQLGDIIKARGNGRLNLVYTSTGDFFMYGNYRVSEGNYLFTAFDLINKRFELEEGGSLTWIGDPYDALIDLRAAYRLKANAGNLLNSIDSDPARFGASASNTMVPVLAYADLKGSLLSPQISLDFELLDDGVVDVSSLNRELNRLQLSEEEKTKQVVSLLVLNRFMPLYSSGSSPDFLGSGLNTGLGDLVSNQLTYWLSSIDEDLQVDVNYRGEYRADGIKLSDRELELALSTTIFNDRVGLNYSYELQKGYSPNKEINYKIRKDGSVRLLLFQRQTQNPVINYNSNTYGFGLFLRREFDNMRELFNKKGTKP